MIETPSPGTERRSVAVVGFDERAFVHRHQLAPEGWQVTCAIDEVPTEPARLGRAVRVALEAPPSAIVPTWDQLLKNLLSQVGVSSYRRFVMASTYVLVTQADGRFVIAPWKPDGRPGYSGIEGAAEYHLENPLDAELGSQLLDAMRDSQAL